MDAFIDDGYTETVGIDAVEGVHPGMEFTYRPFAGDEAADAFRRAVMGPTYFAKQKPTSDPGKLKKRQEKIASEQTQEQVQSRLLSAMAARIQTWNLERPPEPDNIKRLHPRLFARLKAIIFADDDAMPDYRLDDKGQRVEATEDDAANDLKN